MTHLTTGWYPLFPIHSLGSDSNDSPWHIPPLTIFYLAVTILIPVSTQMGWYPQFIFSQWHHYVHPFTWKNQKSQIQEIVIWYVLCFWWGFEWNSWMHWWHSLSWMGIVEG
jgi:hypothetical protein